MDLFSTFLTICIGVHLKMNPTLILRKNVLASEKKGVKSAFYVTLNS